MTTGIVAPTAAAGTLTPSTTLSPNFEAEAMIQLTWLGLADLVILAREPEHQHRPG